MKKILLISSLLMVAACSRSPSTTSKQDLIKTIKTTQSWAATAQMVGETWQHDNIPDIYAEQTLEKSQQEITKETKDLQDSPDLLQHLRQLQQTLQQMTTAVKQHRKDDIAPSLQQLSIQQQQLDTFMKFQEKQS
jgi:hypothetical protein